MDKQTQILNQSLAIRTFPVREVLSAVENYQFQDHTAVRVLDTQIVEYLQPYVDLSAFEYVYPVNGITEALNYWQWQETRSIEIAAGDYQWVTGKPAGEVIYVSNPASYDGNFRDVPDDRPVALDLAYLLSTAPQRITVTDNVERVFFSFSKCFGLRNYRIGYYFSRQPDQRLQALHQSAKYYNYYSMGLGEHLMNTVDPGVVYRTLEPYQYKICNELDFQPSDAVWLANTQNPVYNKFKRNYTNRICIADLIKEQYYNDTK
jgi:hypothetical protein